MILDNEYYLVYSGDQIIMAGFATGELTSSKSIETFDTVQELVDRGIALGLTYDPDRLIEYMEDGAILPADMFIALQSDVLPLGPEYIERLALLDNTPRPSNTTAPAITGGTVGVEITPTPGVWTLSPTITYQWTLDGVAIPGATSINHTPIVGNIGGVLVLQEIANGVVTALSNSVTIAAVEINLPVNDTPASISGSGKIGTVHTATPGAWTDADSITGEWYIAGSATGNETLNYTPVNSDDKKDLIYKETATNTDGDTEASSLPKALTFVIPINTVAPSIAGSPVEAGQVLTGSDGTFVGEDITYSRQWLLDGSPIDGETNVGLTVPTNSVGSVLTYYVSAENSGGTDSETSAGVTITAVPVAANTTAPIITGGTVGVEITPTPGVWTLSPTLTYQWKLDGVDISGATSINRTPIVANIGGVLTLQEIANGSISALSNAVTITAVASESLPEQYGVKMWHNYTDSTGRIIEGATSIKAAGWVDELDPEGYNLSQPGSSTLHPTFNVNKLTFATGNFLTTGSPTIGTTGLFADTGENWTVMAVAEYDTRGYSISKAAVSAGLRQFGIFYSDGDSKLAIIIRGTTNLLARSYTLGSKITVTVTWDGSTCLAYVGDDAPVTLTVGTAVEDTTTSIDIGARSGGAYGLVGSMYQSLIADTCKTPTEIANLKTDLEAR